MAVVSIGLPIFKGTEDDDVDVFIELFIGHLNSLGIDPVDRGGNPPGVARTMGILRSCMQGPAALWFDREITGKNWKIAFIRKNGTAVMNAFRQLTVPEGAGGPNANTYIPGSTAHVYSTDAANAAITIGAAFIPDGRLKGGDNLWRRSGGQPTSDDPNVLYNGVNGNGNPIVLPGIFPDQALFWLRTQYTTILEEKHRLRFTTISQDNMPIREYYNKIVKSAKMLGFGNEIVQDQFYRGLDPDNILEVERIGIEKPIGDLVTTLDKIEKRKAEMHLGLAKRKEYHDKLSSLTTPVKISQQEPVEIKPIAQHTITQDMLNKLLKSHTENLTNSFQAQLQALQNTISHSHSHSQSQSQQHLPKKVPPVIPPKDWQRIADDDWYRENPDFDEYNEPRYERDNRLPREKLRDIFGDQKFKLVGPDLPPKSKNIILAAKALSRAQKAKEDRQVDRLAQLLEDRLDLNDDPMDISNLMDEIILQDSNGNEFTAYVTRSKGSKKK